MLNVINVIRIEIKYLVISILLLKNKSQSYLQIKIQRLIELRLSFHSVFRLRIN